VEYHELIQLSTKGDKQALNDLFDIGEKLSTEQRHEEASKVFRDSAISYRISAFRNSGLAESANVEVNWLNEEIKLIKHWIKANPSGLRPLPRIIEGITNEKILLDILKIEIWPDNQLSTLIELLESALQNNGMEFYSPGGSSLRIILKLMKVYFGISPSSSSHAEIQTHFNQQAAQALEDLKNSPLELRICLDLLADEIEMRFQASKSEY
jgi:hypothetical protein